MSARAAVRRWPLFLIASPAAVGRVGLGGLCGFGPIHPLPGIADSFTLNTAITLPVGVEGYGACALRAWLTPGVPARAQGFARKSAIGALALGMCGQVIYHLLDAAHAARRRGRSWCWCPAGGSPARDRAAAADQLAAVRTVGTDPAPRRHHRKELTIWQVIRRLRGSGRRIYRRCVPRHCHCPCCC